VYVYALVGGRWQLCQRLTDQIYPKSNAGWFGYAIEHGTNRHGQWLAVESTWALCTNRSTQPKRSHGTGDIQMYKLNEDTRKWEFFQYIHPPTTDEFGNNPNISGDWMVCGSLGHFWNSDTNYAYSGAAWFYQFDGKQWQLRQGPVLSADGTNHWNFAYASEIEGTNAFFYGRHNAVSGGAVYLYELRSGTWVETGQLRPDAPRGHGETFGISYIECQAHGAPGIKDDLLVVGAPMRANTLLGGGVYFFQHNGQRWVQIGKHLPTGLGGSGPSPYPDRFTYYGNSGAMKDGLCAIGCRYADYTTGVPHVTDGRGRVDLFEFTGSTWRLRETLAPAGRQQGDWFGSWCATDGRDVYVVSPGAHVNGRKVNRVQLFSTTPLPPLVRPPVRLSIEHREDKVLLGFTAQPGRLYEVQYSEGMMQAHWLPADTFGSVDFDTPVWLHDRAGQQQRFYRLKITDIIP